MSMKLGRESNGPSRDLGDSGLGLHIFSTVGICVDGNSKTHVLMLL